MKKRFLPFLLVIPLIAFALVAAGPRVSAQNKDVKPDDAASKSVASMTVEQMVEKADAMVAKIEATRQSVFDRLQEAKKAEDLPAVDCLNENLTAIKALLLLAERGKVNMKESKGDAERMRLLYARIAQADARVAELEVRARLCRGRAGTYTGDTTVIISPDPSKEGGFDPTVAPWREPILIRRIDASRFY